MKDFFCHDPDGEGLQFFDTEQEAIAAAEKAIRENLSGGIWLEEVDRICVGRVTHRAIQANLREKPPAEEIDEDGCDEDGTNWRRVDYYCDYKLEPAP